MSKIDQVVFIIEEGRVVESTIRDLSGYIDETTTPHGIAPRLHVRGTELWTWGHAGNFPEPVRAFGTEAEAVEALEDSFAYDFWHCQNILAFNNRAGAEAFITGN